MCIRLAVDSDPREATRCLPARKYSVIWEVIVSFGPGNKQANSGLAVTLAVLAMFYVSAFGLS